MSLPSMAREEHLAPKDGTELGAWAASTVMEPLLGNELVKFDAAKFGWIGSMNQDISFCGIWQKPGAATSFQDTLATETIFRSAGPASICFQHPLVLKKSSFYQKSDGLIAPGGFARLGCGFFRPIIGIALRA